MYLKEEGFEDITGIDMCQKMLDRATENKAYNEVYRVELGKKNSIPKCHKNSYDFVVCPSLISNNGGLKRDFDRIIFENLLQCCRVGGYVIFATKID